MFCSSHYFAWLSQDTCVALHGDQRVRYTHVTYMTIDNTCCFFLFPSYNVYRMEALYTHPRPDVYTVETLYTHPDLMCT